MITIKEGDLFSAPKGVICHQVNCKGNMGRGVAKTFREKFPHAFKQYVEYCHAFEGKDILGDVLIMREDPYNVDTCCMFAQDDWRGYGCNTDYAAFHQCCDEIKDYIYNTKEYNYPINMPYNIGCGLGGGDWQIVYSILEEEFENYNLILWRLK